MTNEPTIALCMISPLPIITQLWTRSSITRQISQRSRCSVKNSAEIPSQMPNAAMSWQKNWEWSLEGKLNHFWDLKQGEGISLRRGGVEVAQTCVCAMSDVLAVFFLAFTCFLLLYCNGATFSLAIAAPPLGTFNHLECKYG